MLIVVSGVGVPRLEALCDVDDPGCVRNGVRFAMFFVHLPGQRSVTRSERSRGLRMPWCIELGSGESNVWGSQGEIADEQQIVFDACRDATSGRSTERAGCARQIQ